jgi:hypothetical protein
MAAVMLELGGNMQHQVEAQDLSRRAAIDAIGEPTCLPASLGCPPVFFAAFRCCRHGGLPCLPADCLTGSTQWPTWQLPLGMHACLTYSCCGHVWLVGT